MPPPFPQPQLPEGPKTLVYSTVTGHDITLDYYLSVAAKGRFPAVICYHGGGTTAGSRRGTGSPEWMFRMCKDGVKRPFFMKLKTKHWQVDVRRRAIFWSRRITGSAIRVPPSTRYRMLKLFSNPLQEKGSGALCQTSSRFGTARIAVTGFSAGAYSARAACVYAESRPAALMTAFGLGGNMLLDHWTAARPPTSIARFVNLAKVPELIANDTVISDNGAPGSGRFALTVRWELDGTFLDGYFGKPGPGAMLNAIDYEQRAAAIPEDIRPGLLRLFVTEEYLSSIFVHGMTDELVLDQKA